MGLSMDGTWSVAATVLSYDFLWNEIRVKGGAYGCGFRAVNDRQLCFYTYRDPAIDPSIERIAEAGAWLDSFEPDPQAFEGFIVSCVASHDAPQKPYALTRRQNIEFFTKRPVGWREQLRAEMLACTPDKLRALGEDHRPRVRRGTAVRLRRARGDRAQQRRPEAGGFAGVVCLRGLPGGKKGTGTYFPTGGK